VTLEIYPTLRCNLNCQFCDTTDRHRPPVNELSTIEWFRILDQAKDLGVQQVYVLGGGEPLVRSDTPQILKKIKDNGFRGMLTTNGTLIPNELSEGLLKWGWDEIHFSIDGPTADIHDRLRGQKGAFRKTIRNICRLSHQKRTLGLSSPEIIIHAVLTNQNVEVLPDFFPLAQAIGASRVDVDELIAYRPEQKELQLRKDQRKQLKSIVQKAISEAERCHVNHRLEPFLSTISTERGHSFPPVPNEEGFKGAPCLKAWHHLVIQADGVTSPCCVLAGEGGKINGQSLQQLWNTDSFLNRIRQGMLKKDPHERCQECSWNILSHEANIRAEI
jgi:AdoMet-dependent heme synthase